MFTFFSKWKKVSFVLYFIHKYVVALVFFKRSDQSLENQYRTINVDFQNVFLFFKG